MSVEMTPEIAQRLRDPFPAEKVGKLPRVTCKQCTDNRGSCDRHNKAKCGVCDAWITPAHIHLDFVGHADVTDRFLEADPEWTWEPWALDSHGLPAFDEHGGLWMKLTIAGVTRPGYGDAQGKRGPNAVKEAIGDGLRNAGLRFGVAIDLWRKDFPEAEQASPRPRPAERPEPQPETDQKWLASITERITKFATPAEGRGLWDEIGSQLKAGKCAKGDADRLANLVNARKADLEQEQAPEEDQAPETPGDPLHYDKADLQGAEA